MTSHAIDVETVRHIANLARLEISDQEAEKFSAEFSAIVGYFNMLNEADTSDVPPAFELAHGENVLREDVVQPSMSREEFLKNAPQTDGNYVKTATVLGEGG